MTTSGFKKYYVLDIPKTVWTVECKGTKSVDEVLSTSFFSHLRDIVELKADVSVKANIQIQINKVLSATTNTAREKQETLMKLIPELKFMLTET